MKQKYDVIFSMGEVCFCASFLQLHHYRSFSAPFDWIGGINFVDRINMMLNDFDNFLNIEDLTFTGQRKHPEPCDIYFNERTRLIHNHDFPINMPLEKTFPAVKEKYNRRIARLFEKIRTSEKVLMVYMDYPKEGKETASEKDLIKAMKDINKKFAGGGTIDLLYIRHGEEMADGEIEMKVVNDRIKICRCYNRRRGGDELPGSWSNLKLVFEDITCPGRLKNVIFYFFKKKIKRFIKIFYSRRVLPNKEVVRVLLFSFAHRTDGSVKEKFSFDKFVRKSKRWFYQKKEGERGKMIVKICGIRFVMKPKKIVKVV